MADQTKTEEGTAEAVDVPPRAPSPSSDAEHPPEAEAPLIRKGPPRLGAAPKPAALPYSTGLDTNTRLTLVFLIVVSFVALSAWGAGKLACNYHPSHSDKFTPGAPNTRITRPKDVALEFHHRLFIQDFDAAAELALERGIDVVERRRSECEAACQAQRQQRIDDAATRAVLHRIRGLSAWATAESFLGDQVVHEDYELRRVDGQWLVVGTSPPPE